MLSVDFNFVYVVVNYFFIFHCFWVMVIYANESKTKENQKLTEIKKITTTYSLTCNSPKCHLFLVKSPKITST